MLNLIFFVHLLCSIILIWVILVAKINRSTLNRNVIFFKLAQWFWVFFLFFLLILFLFILVDHKLLSDVLFSIEILHRLELLQQHLNELLLRITVQMANGLPVHLILQLHDVALPEADGGVLVCCLLIDYKVMHVWANKMTLSSEMPAQSMWSGGTDQIDLFYNVSSCLNRHYFRGKVKILPFSDL